MVPPLIRLLRPTHWLKNGLVFVALFFSFSFNWPAISLAALAFVAFSFLASTVYIINDLADVKNDRNHPSKKLRPIASGAVSPNTAFGAAVILGLTSALLMYSINPKLFFAGLAYFVINLFYSFGLKNIPIIDVMIVAIGFLLRVVAGALAITVPVSHWVILCTFFLALFVAFGKRRHEMVLLGVDGRSRHRRSMQEYTEGFINQMLGLSAGTAVVFYALYTIDPATVSRFGTDRLIYTTLIVVFAVLRYYYLLYNRDLGGDPVALFYRDRQLQLAVIFWLLMVWVTYQFPIVGV